MTVKGMQRLEASVIKACQYFCGITPSVPFLSRGIFQRLTVDLSTPRTRATSAPEPKLWITYSAGLIEFFSCMVACYLVDKTSISL